MNNTTNVTDPATGNKVRVIGVFGNAERKNGEDNAITKTWQKWTDAGNPPDGKIQAAEWGNIGGPNVPGPTDARRKPASEANPLKNRLLQHVGGPGIPGPFDPGTTIRLCVSFQKWNDANDNGKVDDGERTENAKIYVPQDGITVPPPAE